MKLYHYSPTDGNVGDDLNPWLWPKVLGNDVLSGNNAHLLIGIGTILNHKIPKALNYTVLTSGVGYGELPNLKIGKWDFVGIRGPLTKQVLNITKHLCLLDGAYLMPRYLSVSIKCSHKVAYIPHVDSAKNGLWEEVCEIAGIKFIDPRMEVEQFVRELCSCEKVLTEAMHGAILADAYGVPWKPVKAYSYINEFKWNDWLSSLDIECEFCALPPTYNGDSGAILKKKLKNIVKRTANKVGYYPESWTPVSPSKSNHRQIEIVTKKLNTYIDSPNYFMSKEMLRNNRVDLLLEDINKYFNLR